MIDTPHVAQVAAQPTAVVRLRVPRNEIQAVMGPAYAELLAVVAAQGAAATGPWFSHHLRMDPDVFDFEVGVPVDRPVVASGRVAPGERPAATVVQTVYHGDYAGLGAAWGELDAWIAAEGLAPAPDLWERYVAGPESGADPAAWRTGLTRPLADPD